MKNIILITTLTTLAVFGVALTAQTNLAFAQSGRDVACEAAGGGAGCAEPQERSSNLIREIVTVLSLAVGVASVFMIMIGGFTYTTSGGDPGKTAKGRQIIIYAVIGLVISIFAFTIVRLVIGAAKDPGPQTQIITRQTFS